MPMIKRLLHPLRLSLGRFVIPPERLQPINPINTLTLFEKVAQFVASEKIEGDYLEFGVFEGWGFSRAFLALKTAFELRRAETSHNSSREDAQERQAIWDNMRFFAFDSFEGLPALEGLDAGGTDFKKGQYAAGVEVFRSKIAGYGVPLDRVKCIPGWFDQTCTPETFAKHKIIKAAVIHIDCDLYSSTKSVLSVLEPVLQDGTIIVFDDWFAFKGNPRRGERRAFNEWTATLEGRYTFTQYHSEGYCRNSFIASQVLAD